MKRESAFGHRKKRPPQHRAAPWPAGLPGTHALLAPVVAHTFQELRIGAAIRDQSQWYPIHVRPDPMLSIELEHGKEMLRQAYNERRLAEVYRDRKYLRGEHAGFFDCFVPIRTHEAVDAVLITGPFAIARPTSDDLSTRWRWLTGRPAYPSDPAFLQYASMTLDVPTFEGQKLDRFERMLQCFASLCAGRSDPRALASEANDLLINLQQARSIETMWEAVRSMIDERTAPIWSSSYKANDLADLGLSQLPEQILVGLLLGRRDQLDQVGELLARDAFQRACVDLARASGNAAAGRVGEHGVVFLIGPGGSSARQRQLLTRLGDQAKMLAQRRFGFALHLGASEPRGSASLSVRYEQALGAAEHALSQGLSIVHAHAAGGRTVAPLRRLREQLGTVTEGRPKVLITRFERYIEAVSAYCGYRTEPIRAHLDAGLDRAMQAMRGVGVLDARSQLDTYDALDRAARDARTVTELFSAYRRAISHLVDSAERPVPAAQDRSLGRARAFIQEHLAERLSLARMARVTGFAPRYFSRLFKQRELVGFEEYVRRLRIERAKHLLENTDLAIDRVAQMSGFSLRPHFHRVFKKIVGATPVTFRSSKR